MFYFVNHKKTKLYYVYGYCVFYENDDIKWKILPSDEALQDLKVPTPTYFLSVPNNPYYPSL